MALRTRIGRRTALSAAAILSWTALFVSLTMGRTMPLTVNRAWLAAFVAVALGLAVWQWLFGVAVRAAEGPRADGARARTELSTTPLLLAVPFLLGIYASDVVFHYLYSNPIPRSVVLWTLPLAVLAWQEAVLISRVRLSVRPARWLASRRSAPLLIFAAFAGLYIFTAGGHLYSPDEQVEYHVTQSLDQQISQILSPAAASPKDAQFFSSKYGLVPSLLALPPYWLSELVGPQPEPPSKAFPIPNAAYPLVDLLVNPLITAATCAVLYCLARGLGFRVVTSLVVVAAYGVTTSSWVYSKTLFSQPPAALFLLACVYFVVRESRASSRNFALAGLSLGAAAGGRAEIVFLAAPLAILLIARVPRDLHGALRPLLAFGVGFLVSALLLVGWYNYVKTGSILMTGHGEQGTLAGLAAKPYIGLFGTLFSSGFGLFVYNPVVMLGVLAIPVLALTRRLEAYAFAGVLALAVLLYGSFGDWFGGFTWANRYLVSVLPLAVLPVGVLLERPWRTGISILLVAAAMVAGFAVDFLGVLFDFNNGWLDLWDYRPSLLFVQWVPNFSPIGAHIRLLHDYLYAGAKLDLYVFYKLGLPSLVLFLLLVTGLASLAVRSALASEKVEKGEPSTVSAAEPAGRPVLQVGLR